MIDVVLADKSHLEQIRRLATNTSFKPYRYLRGEVPSQKLIDYFYQQIIETLTDESSTTCVAITEGNVVGISILKDLAWDSDIFGIKMAKIDCLIADDSVSKTESIKDRLIKAICGQCKERGIEHLSCKVNTDDITSMHALERNQLRLMDTLLDYAFDFRKFPILDFEPPCIIRPIKKGEDKEIAEVARAAFGNYFGRFHADTRLARKDATELYVRWAENACRGYADIVFVAELDKRIVGYSVWKKPGLAEELLVTRVGSLGICGIHPVAHGKGIFKALTLAGMKWLKGKADIIEGPTHINNYPVQRGYATLSWQILGARHTFHKWIKRRAY